MTIKIIALGSLSPIEAMATIGRRAMMDFGLSGLFDRFEKTFGKNVTNALLALIGMAIVSVCLSLIFSALNTAYAWYHSAIGESGSALWEWLSILAGIITLVLILGGGYSLILVRNLVHTAERTVEKAKEIEAEARLIREAAVKEQDDGNQ